MNCRLPYFFPLASALFILLLTIPYGLGYLTTPPALHFTGILMNPEDTQTYFAKMLQGYDGAWRYTITFTPEPHQPELVGVFYVWLGQLARALGLTLIQTWHLARVVAALVLCGAVYWFIGLFVAVPSTRRLAFLLALFGSGLGWLLFLLGQPYWLDHFPVDFKQPGSHLFFTALTYPHIILGTVFILLSVGLLHQEVDQPAARLGEQWPRLLWLSLSNLALAIAYPFLIYLVLGTAVFITLYLFIQQRRILWVLSLRLAASFALAAPLLLYYALTLYTNPVFRAWDVQAVTPSPPLPHYLIAYGPMLLLAGLYAWKQLALSWPKEPQAQKDRLLLWVWILTVCLLLYAPLNPQRRFVQGVHVPLSILTALGFVVVVLPWLWQTRPLQALLSHPRYNRQGMTRLLTLAFLVFMSLSNGYLWLSVSVSSVVQQPDPLFRPAAEIEAVAWVRQNIDPMAIFIGDYQTGNLIPAQAGQRVVLGHWAETVDYEQRTAEVAQFYQAATSDAWRLDLLEQYGVDYVWWGPRERELGDFLPETAVYLTPIYQNETITIFRRS